jgi:hypothetical protein
MQNIGAHDPFTLKCCFYTNWALPLFGGEKTACSPEHTKTKENKKALERQLDL